MENLTEAQERNNKLLLAGIIVNIIPAVAYGVFLIIFSLSYNSAGSPDLIYKALEVVIIVIWSLQILSFSLLLYSTVQIRRLITNNTALAGLIDKNGICLTLMMVILVLVMYLSLYVFLIAAGIHNHTLTPFNVNENYSYATVAVIVAFIA